MSDKPRTMDEVIQSVAASESWDVVLSILKRAEQPIQERAGFHEDIIGASARWVWFAVTTLCHWPADLMDYGTSPKWAWLTPDGKRLLDWLREYGTDEENWPAQADDGTYYFRGERTARDWNVNK